jgi:hypothetical protein
VKVRFIFLGALLALACSARAQISCSPSVSADVCQGTRIFDPGLLRRTIGIPIEIVTPDEYQQRLADFAKEEKTNTRLSSDTNDFTATADQTVPEYFSIFHTHVLSQNGNPCVSFLRDQPRATTPARILASSDCFESYTAGTAKFDPILTSDFISFAMGFIQGTKSAFASDHPSLGLIEEIRDRDRIK